MSDFVRNLVLRAAGLAPVLKPRAAEPVLFDQPEPAIEEIDAEEAAETPPVTREEKRSESIPPRAVRTEKAPAPRSKSAAEPPLVKPKPALPQPREAIESRQPVVERPSVREAVREQARRAERGTDEVGPQQQTRLRSETEPRDEAPRQIEFVGEPGLPGEMLERVASVVEERVQREPGVVQVHIGRVEIVGPRPPALPPPPTPAPRGPRQPRGFAERGLERRYLRRRWY